MTPAKKVADYFEAPVKQLLTLTSRSHRPWPVPRRPWVMGQTWHSLLFAHWRLAPDRLRPRLPAALAIDTHDGAAWLGITPFYLSGLRVSVAPPVPLLSTFPELNLRTYVTVDGKRGIFFFSLDAASRVAVATARRFYWLPYFNARMAFGREGTDVYVESERDDPRGHDAGFVARYRPTGRAEAAPPGTLEHFLTERYCLYTVDGAGTLYRAEIHHPPWPLQPADAEIAVNTMPAPGLALPTEPPLLHFSARQDVLIWPPDRLR